MIERYFSEFKKKLIEFDGEMLWLIVQIFYFFLHIFLNEKIQLILKKYFPYFFYRKI